MNYCLYNIQTGEAGEHRPHRYTVDGKPVDLPPEMVELEVVETAPPVLTLLQTATQNFRADLEAGQLIAEWTVVDPAPEALTAYLARPVPKDLVIRRIREAGKLSAMRTLLGSMTPDQQFEFTQLTELDPTRADLRGGITMLGLDPNVILQHP